MTTDNGNFVRINKGIMKWGWYTDVPTCKLFFHLILKANFTEGKFKDTIVQRGQTITSSLRLSDETGLSRQQIRTAIDKLLATHEITYTSTNKYCTITLCNYEAYNPEGRIPTSTSTSNITIKQPASNQQVTTIEEEEEEEEEEEDKYLSGSREMELSNLLITLIKANNAKTKTPNMQGWCDEISKMNRIDNHSMDDIAALIRWTQRDSFWKTNILSPAKLRKQFPQLWLKMNNTGTGKSMDENMRILDELRLKAKKGTQ